MGPIISMNRCLKKKNCDLWIKAVQKFQGLAERNAAALAAAAAAAAAARGAASSRVACILGVLLTN